MRFHVCMHDCVCVCLCEYLCAIGHPTSSDADALEDRMIEPPEVITQIFRLLKAPRRDIIFSRENVAVHPPSNSGTERITGHLLVVQKRGSSVRGCCCFS